MPKAKKSPPPAPGKYKNGRKCTTLVIDSELVELAKKYFSETKHASFSRFVENSLRTEFRKNVLRIRHAGHALPRSINVGSRSAN